MGAFPNGQGSQPQLLSSLVVLATLPALLMLALWKGGAELDAGSLLLRRKKKAAGKASNNKAVVVVDPYSSGGVLARIAHDEGYQVVRVLSWAAQRMADQSLPAACQGLPFAATIVVRASMHSRCPPHPTHGPTHPPRPNKYSRSPPPAGPTPFSHSSGSWGWNSPASFAGPSRVSSCTTR